LIVDGRNFSELKQIEKTIGTTLKQTTVPGLEPLLPFVNKSRPNNRSQNRNQNKGKSGSKQKNARKSSAKNKNNNDENKSRRQRKGPFGRLNGGVHRKQSDSNKQNPGPKNRNKNTKNGKPQKRNNNNQQNKQNRGQVGLSTREPTRLKVTAPGNLTLQNRKKEKHPPSA